MKKNDQVASIMASNLEVMQASARERNQSAASQIESVENNANKDAYVLNSSSK